MAKEKVQLITPVFRVVFPNVWEATSYKNTGTPKFNLVAVFTPGKYTGKDKERWEALKKAVDVECLRVFKKPWAECRKSEDDGGVADFKPGLRDGSKGKKKDREGFGPGTWFCTLSSQYQPNVYGPPEPDKKKAVIGPETKDTEIYGGIWARATVGVYAYDNVSVGVSIGLNSLQKLKDGKRIESKGADVEEFDEDAESAFLNEQDEPPVGGFDDDIPF